MNIYKVEKILEKEKKIVTSCMKLQSCKIFEKHTKGLYFHFYYINIRIYQNLYILASDHQIDSQLLYKSFMYEGV